MTFRDVLIEHLTTDAPRSAEMAAAAADSVLQQIGRQVVEYGSVWIPGVGTIRVGRGLQRRVQFEFQADSTLRDAAKQALKGGRVSWAGPTPQNSR